MILRELVAALGLDFNQKSFDRAESALKTVKHVAVGLAGALAANAVVRGLADIITSTAEAADQTAKTAASLGLTTQAYQGLSHAAELSNVSSDEFRVAMGQLSRQASEAAGGSKEAGEAFSRFGVKVRDGSGHVRPVDALLGDVAERFKTVKSPTDRAALAMQLFGRAGARMVPLLLEGKAGIKSMVDEVEAFGATFSDDFADQAQEFNDTLTRIHLIVQGFKTMLAAKLLPVVQGLLNKFIAWRKANSELIKTKIAEWGEALAFAMDKVARFAVAVGRVVSWVAEKLDRFSVLVGIATAVLGGLALALGWPAVVAALLGVALILLLEDIVVWSEGGVSLIGHVIDKYKAWVEEFTSAASVDPNEHWLLTFLRDVVALAERGRKALMELYDWWKGGKQGRIIGGGGKVIDAAGQALSDAPSAPLFARGLAEKFLGPSVQPVATASPAAAAASGGSRSEVNVGGVVVHATEGQNAEEVANLTVQKIQEGMLSDAAAALTPAITR